MWNARKLGWIYKIFELILTLTYICRCGVNQHLMVLNLNSASINKVLVTEFIIQNFLIDPLTTNNAIYRDSLTLM